MPAPNLNAHASTQAQDVGFRDWPAVQAVLESAVPAARDMLPGSAVLIPLVWRTGEPEIVFEVRALHLERQPGEVCLPGGKREKDETPEEAAIRETCEELQVELAQITNLLWLGDFNGPRVRPIAAYVAELRDYRDSFDPSEVDRIFTVPLAWFFQHRPTPFAFDPETPFASDFPWDLIPGGRSYPFKGKARPVTFYLDSNPLIWGFTANIINRFVEVLALR